MTRTGHLSRGAPREGPALLSGLLVCGRCGQRMGPGYARGARARFWTYIRHGDRDKGQKGCWTVAGARIDEAVEQLFLDTMGVPSELELALAVDHEVAGHAEELAQQWRARREQAAYDTHVHGGWTPHGHEDDYDRRRRVRASQERAEADRVLQPDHQARCAEAHRPEGVVRRHGSRGLEPPSGGRDHQAREGAPSRRRR